MIETFIYIGAFLVLLGVLVTIHEYGHFMFARLFNVHVQRFSLGMGPVIYKKNDKHGTEFALSAVPLGGYVSMISEKMFLAEPETKSEFTEDQLKNTFESKPKWQRALIMLGGPLANFVLAIFIFSLIFFFTPDPNLTPVISKIDPENSIISSELKELDEITAFNGKSVSSPQDLSLELLSFAGYTGDLEFTIKRMDGNSPIEMTKILYVQDFLKTSESQNNPTGALGLELNYLGKPVIGGLANDGPAIKAGLMKGDLIYAINNKSVRFSQDLVAIVSEIPNETASVSFIRDGQSLTKNLIIGESILNDQSRGFIGIQFGSQRTLIQAISKGSYETYNLSIKTLQFISKMITGNMGAENLSGPIGIAQMAGNTAQAGLLPFIYLMALLSISLGVLNLLPIPVLDGGQLTLLGIEAIRGKPLSDKVENFVYSAGAAMVIFLMIFAVFNDVSRFL
jgi:regulator of sigma E protease